MQAGEIWGSVTGQTQEHENSTEITRPNSTSDSCVQLLRTLTSDMFLYLQIFFDRHKRNFA